MRLDITLTCLAIKIELSIIIYSILKKMKTIKTVCLVHWETFYESMTLKGVSRSQSKFVEESASGEETALHPSCLINSKYASENCTYVEENASREEKNTFEMVISTSSKLFD